jgi:hypothetical protein
MSESKNAGKIIIFEKENAEIEFKIDIANETFWATQRSISELFDTTPQNITIHLKTIFEANELDKASTCKKFLQVQKEGI